MKRSRFALSSEQTLRLEELRATLAEALPADAAERVEFPVARYVCTYCDISCKGICMDSCTGGCVGSCTGGCSGGCKGSCVCISAIQ